MAIRVATAFESGPAVRLTRARAAGASANEHVEPTDATAGSLPVDRYSRSLTGEMRTRGIQRAPSPEFWRDVVSFGGPLVSEEIGALLLRLQEARGPNSHLLIPPAEVERLMAIYQSSNEIGASAQAPYELSTDPESGASVLTLTPSASEIEPAP